MNNRTGEFTKVHDLIMDERTSWIGYFDNSREPVLWIDSGDIVKTQTDPIIGGQLYPGITLQEIREKRDALMESHISTYKLTGPIGIRHAAPGDSIEVRILRLIPGDRIGSQADPVARLEPETRHPGLHIRNDFNTTRRCRLLGTCHHEPSGQKNDA